MVRFGRSRIALVNQMPPRSCARVKESLVIGIGGSAELEGQRSRRVGRSTVGLLVRAFSLLSAIGLALAGPQALLAQAPPSDMQSSHQDGSTFGKEKKDAAAAVPDQQVNGDVVPGYQPAPQSLSQLFASSDKALNEAAGGAVGNEAWQVMMGSDANRSQIDPSSFDDIRRRGQEINDNASMSEVGLGSPVSREGVCEEVKGSPAQVWYEATCDRGVSVSEVAKEPRYSCPPGWTLDGTVCFLTTTQPASVTYRCPEGGSLSGQTCTSTRPADVAGYSCPSGFALSGTNCTRTLTQQASISGYSCPADYELSGTNCVRTLQQSATPVYSCPAGWQLAGNTCNSVRTYQASPSYSCPSGFVLSGTSCSRTVTQPATATSSCPSGYTFTNGNCAMQTTYNATAASTCPPGWVVFNGGQCQQAFSYAATAVYTCPAGFHMEGDRCWTNRYQCGAPGNTTRWALHNGQQYCAIRRAEVSGGCSASVFVGEARLWGERYCLSTPRTNFQCPRSFYDGANPLCPSYTYYAMQPNVNYSCPNGGNLSGSTCSGTNIVGATVVYSCPNGGVISGTTCVVNNTVAPTVTYSCPAGQSLSGTTCSSTTTQAAGVTYTCPEGGTLSGTTCAVQSSQPAAVSYRCPEGWSLSGTQCTSTLSQTATPIYSCPVGYSLSGSMCSRTEVQPATAQYSCPTGHSLSGSTCSKSDPATPVYSCPTGYTLEDTTCSRTVSQPATMVEVCPEGTTVQDGTCYGQTAGKSDCEALEQNTQCTWVKDTCLDENQVGRCKVTERTFRCPVEGDRGDESKGYVCSGEIYCINGSCQTIEREASNDFKDALVAMGAIDQTDKEFDPEKLSLFKGTRETCHKPIFGLVNCCAGKVSGLLSGGAAYAASLVNAPALLTAVATQFLTQFMCSKEEKMLDVRDRLGLCVPVGSYCSSSFLGVCQEKKKAYCCFESKLTRILQEQGRPQINKPWGKPKEEQCEGFTVDEFSRLDMSKMDFSEIYSEFLEAAKLPDEAKMATDIQSKIQQYYQQNGPRGE